MRSPAVYIETFGCQMNEYDTQLVRSILKSSGYGFADSPETADIVLLNTCAIRENAHNKVYGHIGRLKHLKHEKGLVIGVLGCMAQNLKKDLLTPNSLIDVLAGPDSYRSLPELLQRAGEGRKELPADRSEYETYSDITPDPVPGVTAWIAVMRGCDNFCTFCVVPYTRGRERSRPLSDVLAETEALAASGCRQITLLGQNVNSYRDGNHDFADLLLAVANVGGIERVRFMSPHPKDFPEKLLDAVAGHPRISKHIHLPLQAGSDRLLELMGRSYTRKEYCALVSRIRALWPDMVLTTDIIVGFCSETEADYQETCDLLNDIDYQSAYVFKYSERKNTIAARKLKDDVPEAVKSERAARLIELQRAVSLKKNRAMIGQTIEVLIEGESKRSSERWMGRTDGSIVTVFPKTDPHLKPGGLAQVLINDATVTTLYGESP
jgi:tRNA-2-methylthio-N6-dimethylallyladenosine synthase